MSAGGFRHDDSGTRGGARQGFVRRWRWLVLPLSACVLAGLAVYKEMQPRQIVPPQVATLRWPAPVFQLPNEKRGLFRLATYLGRHPLLIVFYDGGPGPSGSVWLRFLREHALELDSLGCKVAAISGVTPYYNRRVIPPGEAWPFPCLSDPDFRVHRQWGAFDDEMRRPRELTLIVSRSGNVVWSAETGGPELPDWAAVWDELQRAARN